MVTKSITTKVCSKIAPLWSLENYVAVNPYLGLIEYDFDETAALLKKVGSITMTMPKTFYIKEYDKGFITQEDLSEALLQHRSDKLLDTFLLEARANKNQSDGELQSVSLVMDVAGEYNKINWSSFFIERITAWAADYFDKGQVVWHSTDRSKSPFQSWKEDALSDHSFKVAGLPKFHSLLKSIPDNPEEAISECCIRLGLSPKNQEIYLHSLLLRVGGWASYIAGLDWDNRLYSNGAEKLPEFLAILLSIETCLLESFEECEQQWKSALKKLSEIHLASDASNSLQEELILQNAYDKACQRKLRKKFQYKNNAVTLSDQPKVQAIFCIDVRSEVFRRNLELVSSSIETLGFAGFFAFPVKYVPIGHEEGVNQCPVLIPSGPVIMESPSDRKEYFSALQKRNVSFQSYSAWKTFKQSAVSCFSFVSTTGISFLPKLFTDAFGYTRPVPHPDQKGMKKKDYHNRTVILDPYMLKPASVGIPIEDQVKMAKSALRAMSLTDNFARLVLIAGHGSSSVNNPHATGLDCGACGGHTGEANAKVAAAVLNNQKVRELLSLENIVIPGSTYFVASLHDTTTDEVTLFDESSIPQSHHQDLKELKLWLSQAGKAARQERALKLKLKRGYSLDQEIQMRSKDWSQVRPEWGLAGCNAFIVAPRKHTKSVNLEGKSFLHSYDWKNDEGFGVLELIMTAPMVVTSWINLQYYASAVDTKHHGAGNKTLHNITAGLGVLEGYSGDLKTGLAWQSVHDGEQFQHLPQRLNVVINAPIQAMNRIIQKHAMLSNLCNHQWIYLFAMNDEGKITHQYTKDLDWKNLLIEEPQQAMIV